MNINISHMLHMFWLLVLCVVYPVTYTEREEKAQILLLGQ